MNIRTVDSDKIVLVGFKGNTRFGFYIIGECWRNLHQKKGLIPHRTDMDFLIGLNDYKDWSIDSEKQPVFDYFAVAQVDKAEMWGQYEQI